MSTQDLTRWNRAGLSQLQYIDGNAATYLEDLRLALRTQFAGNDDVLSWLGEAVTDKNQKEWLERLLEQYRDDRRDYAWEIIRTYARSAHVLAHTMNAYANERYIRTATQWDNVRRLVNMLDYHPAPPASAETYVALFAKTDKEAEGTVEKGLAIKNQPDDGSSPLTFETLEDVGVDYRINQLRIEDYNRSVDYVSIPAENSSFTFYFCEEDEIPESLSVGDRAIVSCGFSSVAVSVEIIGTDYVDLKIIEEGFTATSWAKADLQLHLTPKWSHAPILNGTYVVEVDQTNASVEVGDVLVYKSGSNWYPRKVVAVDGKRIQFNSSVSGTPTFYKTSSPRLQNYESSTRAFVIPLDKETSTIWNQNLNSISPQTEYVKDSDGDDTSTPLFYYVSESSAAEIYFLAQDTPSLFQVVDTSPTPLQFEGKPGELISDDWILLRNDDDEWYSHQVESIDLLEGFYDVETVDSLSSDSWEQASGHFSESFCYLGYDENETDAFSDATDTNCQLTLLLDEVPEMFITGRQLWVVSSTDAQRVTITKVVSEDATAGTVTITVKPSLAGLTLPKYDTWVYGNVVKAGHGEQRAQNVLGDGNRIEKNQSFTYSKTGLAFEQDSDFSSGVRASIEVMVENRRWTQVDNLRNSEATDTDYETELNEDGELIITFGDGIHGQRLPTGTNNVLVQGRFGNGSQGNLDAGSLNKLKKNHALVDDVLQPADATGGGDLESTESLRELAPASVLTLDRAVSVADYGHLAQRHSSIWQALSFSLPDIPGASDRVEVVLVPVEGGELGDLQTTLQSYLVNHSRPGVQIIVSQYQAILLDLDITIRVDTSAYDGDQVKLKVEEALIDAFSLELAKLGAPLYRSKVYQVIESVEGVANVDVVINEDGFVDENLTTIAPKDVFIADDGTVRRVSPTNRQLIYLNKDLVAPDIAWEVADD